MVMCVLTSCSHANNGAKVLTVSIPAQKWLLDSIVGDRFEVITLLDDNSNPETFELSMQTLMKLQNSAVYFTVGEISFEQTSAERIRENFPDLKIVRTSGGISPIHGTHSHADGTEHHEGADPHVWSSLPNARIMARNMYEEVLKLDPKGRDYYTKRYKALDENLAALHDSLKRELTPLKGATFLVWHPSLSYFARDYGLHQVGMEPDGKESSPAQFRAQLDMARASSPSVFFTQKEYDSRQAASMATELGIRTAPVSLMQGDIPAQIKSLADELIKANH